MASVPPDGESVGESRKIPVREAILNAAHASLVEVGFEHITTRRIAEAAGVNIATLHYYYGTKEALLAAVVAADIAASETALRTATEAAPDAPAALRIGMRRAWELVQEQPGRLRFDLAVRGFRNAEARSSAVAIWHVLEDLTCETISRHVAAGGVLQGDLTPETLATHIVTVIDGVVLRFALMRDEMAARRSLGLILTEALRLMGIEDGRNADEFDGF